MDKLFAIYLMLAAAVVITIITGYVAVGVVAAHFILKFW